MPVPGHYTKYVTVAEIEPIEGNLAPELYSILTDWAVWLAKARVSTKPDDYDTQMMLPGSNNVFFGQSVVDGKPKLSENIKGDTATVSLNTVLKDTDGKSVLRKTKITFFLIKNDGAWVVKDVQRSEVSFPKKEPFVYDLMDGLRKDIADFKKIGR